MIVKLTRKKPWVLLFVFLFFTCSASFMMSRVMLERHSIKAVDFDGYEVADSETESDLKSFSLGYSTNDFNKENIDFIDDFWQKAGFLIHVQEQDFIVIPTKHGLDFRKTFAEFILEVADQGYSVEFEIDADQLQGWLSVALPNMLPKDGQVSNNNTKVYYRQLSPSDSMNYPNDNISLKPKLAIIIDDWGYSSKAIAPILDYPFPLTTAILPYLPVSKEVAERSFNIGHEVILHQPMEAISEYMDIGEGGITTNMDSTDIAEQIKRNIMHLPMVKGVNNHMGSKATADYETMRSVLETLNGLDLFFVDSLTTPSTVTEKVAKEVAIPYAVNMLFLDNINEVEEIKGYIRQGLGMAKRLGSAIVIGHVRAATATALWEMIPEILDSGVELVPVSQLLIYTEPVAFAYENHKEEGAF